MAGDAEVGAIIGGSVAGAGIIIIIVAVLIYLLCGKRRRKKERDEKKFRQLTPHTSPAHSQPSSLGHGHPADPRLPKVGSNGLWMGTPGIYAATPSPAYYYGRQSKTHHLMQPAVMQRTNSDPRLLPRGQVPPSGPNVYTTGGTQQRIYHSQGIPSPLSPLYEVRDPHNGSVYDVYQIGGGSTSRLLQDGSKSSDRPGRRLQRSQSDVVPDPSRRPYRSKFASTENRPASSKTGKPAGSTAQVHRTSGLENPAFSESTEKIITNAQKVAVDASATDSMKLLAKNKTDDQKTVVQSSSSSAAENRSSPSTNNPSVDPSSLHYTYQGDIYAVPDKDAIRNRPKPSNASPAHGVIASQSGDVISDKFPETMTDIEATRDSMLVIPTDGQMITKTYPTPNPIYEEAEDILRDREYMVIPDVKPSAVDGSGAVVRSVAVQDEAGSTSATVVAGVAAANDVAAASAGSVVKDAGASGLSEGQPETTVVKRPLESQWSSDTEGAADEISRAGKHISVTAQAFEFLDKYLSDEEGDVHSPPNSPTVSGRLELR